MIFFYKESKSTQIFFGGGRGWGWNGGGSVARG